MLGTTRSNSSVGHVDFVLFVSLSLALGSQHEYNFQWNMGFRVINISYLTFNALEIQLNQPHAREYSKTGQLLSCGPAKHKLKP